MIDLAEYRRIVSELIDELPEEFFRKLSGGVVVSEAIVIPDYAVGHDPTAGPAETKEILRGILRHEFRHHLEFLSGIHDTSSLEAQDERQKQSYLERHRRMTEQE